MLRPARLGVVLLIAVVSACTADTEAPADRSDSVVVSTAGPPVAAPEHGTLVAAEPVADVDRRVAALGATALRLRYRSTSGVDGSPAEVTGIVFVPAGPAPAGGRSVVTVGHGTTGGTDDCAPSRYPNLLGSIDLVIPLLERGYLVAVSDLDGLGNGRPHPYLEPDTAGYNLIDIVRAAQAAVPETSNRWAALGESQGGQASWSAAELAPGYAAGLDFVGAANLSPAADVSPVAEPGTVLSVPQQMFLPLIVSGLAVSHPELDPDAYLHGALSAQREALVSCTTPAAANKIDIALGLRPADSEPRTPQDRARIGTWLRDRALPKRPAGGPMLVLIDERDNSVRPEWTRAAVERACALGDVIELRSRPDGLHADPRDVPVAVDWVADRFDGVVASTTCPSR